MSKPWGRMVSAACLFPFVMLSASTAVGGNVPDPPLQLLDKIRATAMDSNWAWNQLETLTDSVGPRLSGSLHLDAAIHQLADRMRFLGARVTLPPTKVPHWIRGEEHAQLTDYAGRPAG